MAHNRVGLLPLYLELYDRVLPEARTSVAAFYETVVSELTKRGLEVIRAPVCRLQRECADAVRIFEDSGVDAIVTLHLAYSPSLESADVLAATRLPIIVLDTTPDESFGPMQDPARLMNNHGVHGVQDLCNLLRRRGKPFRIEAGHWRSSDVLDRVCAAVSSGTGVPAEAHVSKTQSGGEGGSERAARVAGAMRQARVGLIGQPFHGMGDFQVEADVLRTSIGMEVLPIAFDALCALLPAADDPSVEQEIASDREVFHIEPYLDRDAYVASLRASLAVRHWIERDRLTAFTVNFDAVGKDSGLPAMPFLEASKGMARGIGYAGEGDVLTAGFVGALASVYPETTFTEIFCPDWADNTLFLSHMAEMNVGLCAGKPSLLVKPMPWMALDKPAVALGRFRGGDAVFVDLAPGPENTFSLILAPVRVVEVKQDRMDGMVRGWIRPAMPIADFLARYSRAGGTHHAAMVYGNVMQDLAQFGSIMNWDVIELG